MSPKKLIITFFVPLVVLLISSNPLFAQTPTASPDEPFNFERAYKDYLFTYESYQKAHADYLLARSQYMQAKTLTAQTKAKDSTAKMLQSRDDVMVTYLTALRMRLSEANGVGDSVKEGLFSRLDSEVAWYKNHRQQVESAGTLEDLVEDSDEAKEHFTLTEPVIYSTLSNVPIGTLDTLISEASNILTEIKTKTSEIRSNGDHDTTLAERWILETDGKLTRSLDKKIEAQSLIPQIESQGRPGQKVNRGQLYNNVIDDVQEAHVLLREAKEYMKEIVKEIKTE